MLIDSLNCAYYQKGLSLILYKEEARGHLTTILVEPISIHDRPCRVSFRIIVKGVKMRYNKYLGAKYYLIASKVYGKLGNLGICSIPLCEAQSACIAC